MDELTSIQELVFYGKLLIVVCGMAVIVSVVRIALTASNKLVRDTEEKLRKETPIHYEIIKNEERTGTDKY